MHATRDERSIGQLLGELADETSTLVRQELALARAEVGQKVGRIGRDLGFLAVGGAIAYAGFLAILGAAVFLLAQVMPLWLAALIVGLVVAGGGYLLVQRGLAALRAVDLAPRRTLRTLKDDVEWAKEQTA